MGQHIALIRKDSDSGYGVSRPDLARCVTARATLDEARDMAPPRHAPVGSRDKRPLTHPSSALAPRCVAKKASSRRVFDALHSVSGGEKHANDRERRGQTLVFRLPGESRDIRTCR